MSLLPPDDLVGRSLGHFRVVARVGEGGMGAVYKAFDERLHRTVALKVLPMKVQEESQRRAFLLEARSAAAVSHPNVATVHDVDEAEGRVFLAMEYIEGRTLRREIGAGRLDVVEALRIARGIARALAKAHEKGVVHRDLKPDNVMLNEDREVKVLDFGLAKMLEAGGRPSNTLALDDTELQLTVGTQIVGTPSYMSPEQVAGAKIDARADQFSFGIVLYEMLTGERPFRGGASLEILAAISRDAPAPASSLNPRIPAALESVLERCLAKNPQDRFASARDLVAALEAIDAGGPTSLRGMPAPPSAGLPMNSVNANITKPVRTPVPARGTWRRYVPAAVLVAAAAALGGAVVLRGREVAAPPSTHASPASPEAERLVTEAEKLAREGRRDLACAAFARASDRDPAYGKAALSAALCHLEAPNEGRAYFRRAWAARAAMGDKDARLVFAVEPVFLREHEDDAEEARRLEDVRPHLADDPRFHMLVASSLRRMSNGFREVIEEMDRSLALDPEQPYAMELKADTMAYEGDFAGALAVIDQCLERAPAAEGCLLERTWINGAAGACDKVEADARRMLAIDPDDEDGAHVLANALYAQNGVLETAREALRRSWEKLPPESREPVRRDDEIDLAILSGDLAAAEEGARAALADASKSALVVDHGRAARRLVTILEEMGREKDAADVARTYLDGRDAWEPSARLDDWALAGEPTPLMERVLLRAGRITADTYRADLRRTLERWERTVEPPVRPFLWIEAYAVPAEDADQATAALLARDRYLPVPTHTPLSLDDEAIGRAYLLAGKPADAIPHLERAVKSCFPVENALEHTRAAAMLGRAREMTQDGAGACAAYGIARARWGHAKPSSVTGAEVGTRAAGLKCGG
jgi:serine/threonine-protein kinase